MATAPKKPTSPTSRSEIAAAIEPPTAVENITSVLAEPAAEVQDSLRSAMEKGVAETRAAFAKAKVSAEEAASAFETCVAAATQGAAAFNAKVLEALRVNVEANFDLVQASWAVKTPADWVALQSDFLRKRAEAASAQAKDFGALAQKLASDVAQPLKDQFAKTFQHAL